MGRGVFAELQNSYPENTEIDTSEDARSQHSTVLYTSAHRADHLFDLVLTSVVLLPQRPPEHRDRCIHVPLWRFCVHTSQHNFLSVLIAVRAQQTVSTSYLHGRASETTGTHVLNVTHFPTHLGGILINI